ncbi:hypothetical protein ACIQZG_12350 [Lysinibacillus sp. NPDC096418]|uniref:hypothetical protein n=1 Tax=Lysinibacillus sp. NPDC096418 TaxID=3364138 RepID=UPI00382474FD
MQALNNNFTATKISFLDSFDEGVQKNSVVSKDESFEGVVCKAYEDDSNCIDNYDTTQVNPLPLTGMEDSHCSRKSIMHIVLFLDIR